MSRVRDSGGSASPTLSGWQDFLDFDRTYREAYARGLVGLVMLLQFNQSICQVKTRDIYWGAISGPGGFRLSLRDCANRYLN